MPNISQLSNIQNAASALSNLILVTPQKTKGIQPQNGQKASFFDAVESEILSQPPPSIIFHYEGEQSAQLQSDITDQYIENNSAVQDHIALRPEIITTHGFIGELNDVTPKLLEPIKFATTKLTTISAYEPALSQSAIEAYNAAFTAYQVASNAARAAVAAWSSLSGGSGTSLIDGNGITVESNQSKQQQYFQMFYGYWRNRTLFTVQTPWAIFKDMAILSLRAIQGEDTRVISDFEVTFKLLRFASTRVATITTLGVLQGRTNAQYASVVNGGTSNPIIARESFASKLR